MFHRFVFPKMCCVFVSVVIQMSRGKLGKINKLTTRLMARFVFGARLLQALGQGFAICHVPFIGGFETSL